MKKLVRDMIPLIIAAQGDYVFVERQSKAQTIRQLKTKLKEEQKELWKALDGHDTTATINELVDVIEVVLARLCLQHPGSILETYQSWLVEALTQKREQRGSFLGGLKLCKIQKGDQI